MATLSHYQLVDARGTKLSISHDDLRRLFGAVETEFCQSDIYRQALAGLQQRLGSASEEVQTLIRALGREAIRLALRQMVRRYQEVPKVPPLPTDPGLAVAPASFREAPPPAPAAPQAPEPVALKCPVAENPARQQETAAPVDTVLAPAVSDGGPNAPVAEPGDRPCQPYPAPTQAPSPSPSLAAVGDTASVCQPSATAPPAMSEAAEPSSGGLWRLRGGRPPLGEGRQRAAGGDRESVLRQIGSELHQARQSRSLSIEQVHYRTHVPLHQLKALEAGHIDQLPEDVYVRGFVQRLGDALALDGASMAHRIPLPDTSKTVLPSWQQIPQRPAPASYLRPAHLYVGYAALMAGAAGGLFWMTWQPSLDGLGEIRLRQLFNQGEPASPEPSRQRPATGAEPLASGVKNWAIAHPELAPLEMAANLTGHRYWVATTVG